MSVNYLRGLTPDQAHVQGETRRECAREFERQCEECEEACILIRAGEDCDKLKCVKGQRDRLLAALRGCVSVLEECEEADTSGGEYGSKCAMCGRTYYAHSTDCRLIAAEKEAEAAIAEIEKDG